MQVSHRRLTKIGGRTDRRTDKRPRNTGPNTVVLDEDSSVPQEIEHEDPSAPFLPNFTCPDGQPIKATNSLYDNPLLAMTLLKGVVLPEDLSRLPKKMVDNVAEMCFYTAKV